MSPFHPSYEIHFQWLFPNQFHRKVEPLLTALDRHHGTVLEAGPWKLASTTEDKDRTKIRSEDDQLEQDHFLVFGGDAVDDLIKQQQLILHLITYVSSQGWLRSTFHHSSDVHLWKHSCSGVWCSRFGQRCQRICFCKNNSNAENFVLINYEHIYHEKLSWALIKISNLYDIF